MSEPTKSANVLNASESFMIATAGMADMEKVDFWFAYLFSLDRLPGQSYEDFLPIWQRWQARKEGKQSA